jgi:hypothetical protein
VMLSSSRTSQRFARLLSTSNLLRLARARASLPTRPVVGECAEEKRAPYAHSNPYVNSGGAPPLPAGLLNV